MTTNPSLVAKEGGVDFKQHIAAICEIVQGEKVTFVGAVPTVTFCSKAWVDAS